MVGPPPAGYGGALGGGVQTSLGGGKRRKGGVKDVRRYWKIRWGAEGSEPDTDPEDEGDLTLLLDSEGVFRAAKEFHRVQDDEMDIEVAAMMAGKSSQERSAVRERTGHSVSEDRSWSPEESPSEYVPTQPGGTQRNASLHFMRKDFSAPWHTGRRGPQPQ